MSKYKLYGFFSSPSPRPFFIIPIFEKSGSYFVQEIKNDKIDSFEKINKSEVSVFECGYEALFEAGDDALYGISDNKRESNFSTKGKLKSYLTSNINSYIDAPFFYRAVSEFCEYSIPEFYSCNLEKDFLTRQIISNYISEYVNLKKVKLERRAKKYNPYINFNPKNEYIFPTIFSISEQHENLSLKDIYYNVITFAVENSNNLQKSKALSDALNISKEVIPRFKESNEESIDYVYKNLLYLLKRKVNPQNKLEKNNGYKLTKHERKSYGKNIGERLFDSDSMTSDGLSLIIYITSRLIQETHKERS